MIYVDDVLLREVFANIVENAMKYTPAGTPIEITAEADGGEIAILIRDHGPGFAPGDHERVFEKFYRGATNPKSGMGLRLAICCAVVTGHGGVISATNAVTGGAVVRIKLPVGGTPPFPMLSEGTAQ
jgi:two-component system sensor histidine kinase KdpD